MVDLNLQTPTIRVPGLLDDSALQEQLKQFKSGQGQVMPTPTGAVEMADRVNEQFFSQPVRTALRAGSAFAGPVAGSMMNLASSVSLPSSTPAAQPDAQQRALDVRSDILSSDSVAPWASFIIGGAPAWLAREGGYLGEAGTLSAEESKAAQEQNVARAKEAEQRARDLADTHEKLRNLTDDQAAAMGFPIAPGGLDKETADQMKQAGANLDAARIKAAETEVKRNEDNAPTQTWWLNAIRSFSRATGEGLTSIGKAPIIALYELPGELSGLRDPGRSDMRAWFDTVDETMNKLMPPDKSRSEDFDTILAAGAGSMTSFLVSSVVGATLGLPARMTTTAVGGSMGASQQYEDAEEHHAAALQRLGSFILGGALGASEAIPINRALGRLEKSTGGAVSRLLATTATSSAEEFVQELGQNFGQDVVAKYIYDAQREYQPMQYLKAAAVGGILGAMGGAAVGTLQASGVIPHSTNREETETEDTTQASRDAQQQSFLEQMMLDSQIAFDEIVGDPDAGLDAATELQRQQFLDEQAAQQPEEVTVDLDAAAQIINDVASGNMEIDLNEAANQIQEVVEAAQGQTLAREAPAVQPVQLAEDLLKGPQRPATKIAEEFAEGLDRGAQFDYEVQTGRGGTVPAGDVIVLRHWSAEARETIDPSRQGTGPLIGQERARLFGPDAVDRSYFGVRSGPDYVPPRQTAKEYSALSKEERQAAKKLEKAGVSASHIRQAMEARYRRDARRAGYKVEGGLGDFQHEVEVGKDDLYNVEEDVLGLREQITATESTSRVTQYERLIKDAGFKGAYFPQSALGATAIMFEATTPSRVIDQRYGLPVSEIATPEDFNNPTPETFTKGGWGVLTATQEAQGRFDSPENVANDEKLRKRLAKDGVKFVPVEGAYQGEPQGPTYMIFAPEEYIAKLGKSYKQESILTRDGLVYTDGTNRLVPGRGVTVGPEAETQDFFSKMPNGTAWTMDLDFEGAEVFGMREPDGGTEAFKKWFGDSKVVDGNGKPLVVYHGTKAEFSAFDTEKGDGGSHFGTYTQASNFDSNAGAFYLSIKNPVRMQDLGQWDDLTNGGRDELKGQGYDGVVYLNRREGVDVSEADQGDFEIEATDEEFKEKYPEAEDSWIAFEPTQIKSVNNAGNFDPNNPDFYASTSSSRGSFQGEQRRPAQVPGATNPNADDVSLRQISDNFAKLLDLVVRQGRFTLKKAVGQYSSKSGVIRMKTANDLSTLVHEGAHALEVNATGFLRQFVDSNKTVMKTAARQLYGADLANQPERVQISEGFAEFFRVYTLNRAFARVHYPQLTQDFTDLLNREDPALKLGLDIIGDQYAAWLQMPSSQLVRNMIQSGRQETGINAAIAEAREQGLVNWFREKVNGVFTAGINRYNGLNGLVAQVLNQAEAAGAPIDLKRSQDPRVLIRMATNVGNRAMVQLTDGVMGHRSTKPSTVGLRGILLKYHGLRPDQQLGAIDVERQRDFAAYVVALRGVDEYARMAQGIISRPPLAATLGDLQETIAELETKYGNAFREAARDMHDYGMALWEKSYQAGLLDPTTYQDGLTRGFYVPLQRDVSDKMETQSSISASAVARGGSIVKQFKGSDRDIIDPMDALMQKTFALEKVIAENEVKVALARLADKAGTVGALVERVPASRLLGQQYSVEEVAKQLTKDPTMSATDAADLMAVLEHAIDDGNRIALFRSQQAVAGGENVVFFWEKGKLAALQLKDGDVGVDIINTLNAVGTENVPLLVDLIAYPSTVFRAAVTSWPDFLLVNFIRDQMSAFVLTEGYTPFVTGLKGVGEELRQHEWAREYNAAMGTMGGMNSSTLHDAKVNQDINALRKRGYLARAFRDRSFKGVAQGVARVTELTETGTRLGIFKQTYDRAKRDGLSDWDASIEASYIATDYIDFGLHGNRMMAWRRLIPFLNAQLQGLYKMMRTLGGDEVAQRKGLTFALSAFFKDTNNLNLSRAEQQAVRVGRKAWLKMASLGLIGAALQAVFADDPDYQDASEYLRTTGWVIPIGDGQIIYIPKPFELAMVSNFVERGMEMASGDKEAKNRLLRGMAMNLVPPTNPPAIQAAVEQLANHSFFGEREIVPDYMLALQPELQYNNYTTEFAKSVGNLMGWSPMRIDHLMSSLGASAYRDLSALHNMTDPGRASTDVTDWPMTRRFVRDARRGAASAQDFWKFASTVNGTLRRAEVTYKNMFEAGKVNAAENYLDELEPDEKAYALLNTHFSAEYKKLNPTYRTRQLTQIVSAMRRELNGELGVENSMKGFEADPIMLSAKEKADVDTLLSEYARREVRNSLVYMKAPGWANKAPLDTESTVDIMRATHPEIAEEFDRRVRKAKVYDAETVREYWPEVRDRLNTDRDEAFLKDILTIAKAMRP